MLSNKEHLDVLWLLLYKLCENNRSSCPEVFFQKDVLRDFTKFTGKHLCQSLQGNFIEITLRQGLHKKESLAQCFPVNFAKFLRTPFLTEHLWCLLLFKNF